MLRITKWRVTGTPPADTTPMAAIQSFQEMCSKLEGIRGAGRIRFYLGDGGIVTVGEPESYGAADEILKSREAQMAVGRVLALGYNIVEDQFLLEPSQVMPFAEASTAVPAGARR
jgi:hypothetical protein